MPVSPQDYELYSRATGTPLPQTPQERALLAPDVYRFTRSAVTKPSLLKNLGKAATLAGGAALVGLTADYLAKNPIKAKTPIVTANDDFREIPREELDAKYEEQRGERWLDRKMKGLESQDKGDEGTGGFSITGTPEVDPKPPGQGGNGAGGGVPRSDLESRKDNFLNDYYGYGTSSSLGSDFTVTPGEQLNQSHVGTQTNVVKDAFITQKAAQDIASDTINEAYSQKGLDTSATVNIDGEFDPGNTRIYSERIVPRQQRNIDLGSLAKAARGPAERWADNIKIEQYVPYAGAAAGLGAGAHEVSVTNAILRGEIDPNQVGGAIGQTVTDVGNQLVGGFLKNDPTINLVSKAAETAQDLSGQVLGNLANLGFRGTSLGDLASWGATHAPGHEFVGNVLQAAEHLGHAVPLEAGLLGLGTAGLTAILGTARAGYRARQGKLKEDLLNQGPARIKAATKGLGQAAKLAQKHGAENWERFWLRNEEGETVNENNVEVGSDHLANDNPGTPPEQQNTSPSREIHESDDLSNDVWGDHDSVGTVNEQGLNIFRSSPSYKMTVTGGDDELVGGTAQEVPSPIEESAPSVRDRSTDFVSKLLGEMPPEVAVEIKSQEPERSYRTEDSKFAEFGQNQMGDPYVTFHEKPTKANPDRTGDSKRYSYPVDARTSEQITNVMEGDEEGNIFDYFRGSDVKESDIIKDVLNKAGRYEEDDEGNWTPRL
jgi:hypothetical protein